jgi:hypothetical protein
MRQWRLYFIAYALTMAVQSPSAFAQDTISTIEIGGSHSVLIVPPKPTASVILLAGGNGDIGVGPDGMIARPGNQLVRTRLDYVAKGFAVLVPDVGYHLTDLVEKMKTIKRPVVVVGTSRGTQRAAIGLSEGAKPDKLVLTSGMLSDASGAADNVVSIVDDPKLLPPTLIIHHREDHCRVTKPEGVAPFMEWAGKKAKLVWLDGGDDFGDPCEAKGHHGFQGIDQKVVDLVSAFVK